MTPAATHSETALHCDLFALPTPAVTPSLTQWPFYQPTLDFTQRPTAFPLKSGGTYPGTAALGFFPSETRTNGTVSRRQGL